MVLYVWTVLYVQTVLYVPPSVTLKTAPFPPQNIMWVSYSSDIKR